MSNIVQRESMLKVHVEIIFVPNDNIIICLTLFKWKLRFILRFAKLHIFSTEPNSLLSWTINNMGMFCKELRVQTYSFILSMRQARQTNNLEIFFFIPCWFLLMSQSKKGNREVNWSELQILFIHPKFHDSNNMYNEGVIYSKVLNFKQETLKRSLKKRGY